MTAAKTHLTSGAVAGVLGPAQLFGYLEWQACSRERRVRSADRTGADDVKTRALPCPRARVAVARPPAQRGGGADPPSRRMPATI